MNKLEICKLEQKDQKEWQKLWQSYLEFYQTSRKHEIYLFTFNQLINRNNVDCDGFIAFLNGKAVGLVHLVYHIHLWQQQKICYLQDLFVDEAYRKNGIATELIKFAYSHADKKGLNGVYWVTDKSNITARKVYDKIARFSGFVKYTRK